MSAAAPPEVARSPWVTLRTWAPVVTVVVALLALFATLAILVGGALGRMETRLRADVAALAVEVGDLRAEVGDLRADVAAVRADVHAVAERVARIEGTLAAWRPPANGSPSPSTVVPP